MDDASRKADVPAMARWAVRLRSDGAIRSIYQGAAEARKVAAPMLVIAGIFDTTVPPAQARQVLDATVSTSKRVVMVEGADHNTLLFQSAPASTAVMSFLPSLKAATRPWGAKLPTTITS
jgi:pimeloyl-ACP methyl ester carboxylesterase